MTSNKELLILLASTTLIGGVLASTTASAIQLLDTESQQFLVLASLMVSAKKVNVVKVSAARASVMVKNN